MAAGVLRRVFEVFLGVFELNDLKIYLKPIIIFLLWVYPYVCAYVPNVNYENAVRCNFLKMPGVKKMIWKFYFA